MPRGDRTGPGGMGPMTGRAAGYCAGSGTPGFMNPYGGRFSSGAPMGGGGYPYPVDPYGTGAYPSYGAFRSRGGRFGFPVGRGGRARGRGGFARGRGGW